MLSPSTTADCHLKSNYCTPQLELPDRHLYLRPNLVWWWSFHSSSLLCHNMCIFFHLFHSLLLNHALFSWESKKSSHTFRLLLQFIHRSMTCSWALEVRRWWWKARWGNGTTRWSEINNGLTGGGRRQLPFWVDDNSAKVEGEREKNLCYIHVIYPYIYQTLYKILQILSLYYSAFILSDFILSYKKVQRTRRGLKGLMTTRGI